MSIFNMIVFEYNIIIDIITDVISYIISSTTN